MDKRGMHNRLWRDTIVTVSSDSAWAGPWCTRGLFPRRMGCRRPLVTVRPEQGSHPYGVISTVAQRSGEIYLGMGAILVLGQNPIDTVYAKNAVGDVAPYRSLDEISPLRSGGAGPPVEMTTTALFQAWRGYGEATATFWPHLSMRRGGFFSGELPRDVL